MKIEHIWSVLCKESVINQDDNNISIYGVLEKLSVSLASKSQSKQAQSDKVGIPLNYEIVSLWQKKVDKKSAKAEIEYLFWDPDGKELLRGSQTMEIPKDSRRFRSRMKIIGMPLTKSGDYTFSIRLKEKGVTKFKLVKNLPLEVTLEKQSSVAK